MSGSHFLLDSTLSKTVSHLTLSYPFFPIKTCGIKTLFYPESVFFIISQML
jgi:hypothetical protein